MYEPYRFEDCEIILGDNNFVEIKASRYLVSRFVVTKMSKNNKLFIGKHFATGGCRVSFHDEDNMTLKIGDYCMFSSGIVIRYSDGHAILDKDTKLPLNPPPQSCMTIGNNCWIGAHVSLLKGAKIPNWTVVSMKAMVTKPFEKENTIIGGFPAKVLKENVIWDRRNTQKYMEDLNKKGE